MARSDAVTAGLPAPEDKRQQQQQTQRDKERRRRSLTQAVLIYLFVTAVFVLFCSLVPDDQDTFGQTSGTANTHRSFDPSSFRSIVVDEKRRVWQDSQRLLHGIESRVLHEQNDRNGKSGLGVSGKDTISVDELVSFLSSWLHELHDTNIKAAKVGGYLPIWKAYHELVQRTLIPWDHDYLQRRMPPRRQDNSIFLSIASYRDENCPNTLEWAFGNATYPERLFIGLVQQNCVENCRTGVLERGVVQEAPPDPDCYVIFCTANPQHCQDHHVRLLRVNESESLGPYGARFLASKLWHGESWYMQTDAHMTFLENWDAISIDMLHKAPSEKPVLSHYPPGHKMDLHVQSSKPAGRLCGPLFATSTSENQIVRLEGLAVSMIKNSPRLQPLVSLYSGCFYNNPIATNIDRFEE